MQLKSRTKSSCLTKRYSSIDEILFPSSSIFSQITSRSFFRSAALAVALSGFSISSIARAQSVTDAPSLRLKYAHYKDFQSRDENRITVSSPMFLLNAPLGNSWEVESGGILDSVSGASPLYLDSLSGASGNKIDDKRKAVDIKFTKYFDNFSIGAGGAYSDEHDYRSKTSTIESRIWNEDKTTVLSIGSSVDWDHISSTNDPTLSESRTTANYLIGVTQIINPVSMIQSNLTYDSGDGYFSDPYKLFDKRPNSREEWAWLNRYVLFIKELEGSLHFDYRLFQNTWSVTSHTFTLSYYHPMGEDFIIAPSIRYYLQSKAQFFNTQVPPSSENGFNSADQRLASFGSISPGLKLIYRATNNLEFDALYEYMSQSNDYSLTAGDDFTRNLGAHYFEIGMMRKF